LELIPEPYGGTGVAGVCGHRREALVGEPPEWCGWGRPPADRQPPQ